ncbi:hypothetical protein EU534_00140 [Candidatus Heimdallarchaeota archaeon]|nr:MAG: hypothetical protein EU534_00140 [Candidatus Heimdallarchaeota archaeon]
MKSNKLITYILILSIAVLTVVTVTPVTQVCADTPGTVTIDEGVLEDDILYYNTLTVKFTVTKNAGWFYGGSWIFINNVCVGSTSEISFEQNYFPEAYAGSHSLYVEANFVNLELETAWADDAASYNVITCVNRTNIEDLRIDKLHDYESNKGYLDGSGINICIIDDQLGTNDNYNDFHKSLYYSGKNDIYEDPDRRYIDIQYYEWNETLQTFQQHWNSPTSTRKEKWEELFNENKGDYDNELDVHGTYHLATMRQIAPGANITFIEVGDILAIKDLAISWIADNYTVLNLDFDIISFSSIGSSSWEQDIETIVDHGVLFVSAAGNDGIEMDGLPGDGIGYYPQCFNTTIGVTGVTNSYYYDPNFKWQKESGVNWGFGIDIACISNCTVLDWSPVPNDCEFGGTSNAAPIIAGIMALVEEYQDNYKPANDLNIFRAHTTLKYTGDAPNDPPRLQNLTEVAGYYSFVSDEQSTFPYFRNSAIYETYLYGWGIIDAYEFWKYFKNNY